MPARRRRSSESKPWQDRRCRPTLRHPRQRETRALPIAGALSTLLSRCEIEEMQLAAASLECTCRFALQHHGDQAVARIENQHMERALGARAIGRGIFLERELEECVQLDGRTAAQR